jgi:predicted small lipoprotein YifL
MTLRILALAALALSLTACGEAAPQKQRPQAIATPPIKLATGLDRVMGKDARSLVQLFGPAAQDVREASARKLQFSGASCVLDAYLYPPATGKEPVVTFLAARVPDGRDADKAACVTALSQKR